MTCLYCGKKLGFFSRYKDTPFCSEEHLRAHQDEMERALMERLGSKISAQAGQKEMAREEAAQPATSPEAKTSRGRTREAKPAEDSPRHFDAPLDIPPAPAPSARATGSSSRRGEVRNFPSSEAAQELALTPASERPIDKRALLEGRDIPPPEKQSEKPAERAHKKRDDEPREGNLCEDFFESDHQPIAALDPLKPAFAPSTFAIIVQADFCTPTLPEAQLSFEPAPVEDEFELLMDAAAPGLLETAPPTPANAEDFRAAAPHEHAELPRFSGATPTGMPTVASLAGAPAEDIWDAFPTEESLFELDFGANLNAGKPAQLSGQISGPLGGRPEIPVRTRHRFPYPGSNLHTSWTDRSDEFGVMSFTESSEWSPVEPGAYRNVLEDRIAAEKADIRPQLEVQLSLHALWAQVIHAESETAFERDPRTQPVRVLSPDAGVHVDSRIGDWAMAPHLPRAATPWHPHFRFPKSNPARPMPAVNFPSLFQLNPAMPPRPEGVLHG
jgi:hypothetical protein